MSKKYYERALRGTGVHSKEFFSSFGASILKKFGWEEGTALGTRNSGLTSCIQVERREERVGLGISSQKDAENQWDNWWDELYNSTVEQVKVDNQLKGDSSRADKRTLKKRSKKHDKNKSTPLNAKRQKGKLLRLEMAERRHCHSRNKEYKLISDGIHHVKGNLSETTVSPKRKKKN